MTSSSCMYLSERLTCFFPRIRQEGRGTKYIEGKFHFMFILYVPLGLINIFLHVERDKISYGLEPTSFS